MSDFPKIVAPVKPLYRGVSVINSDNKHNIIDNNTNNNCHQNSIKRKSKPILIHAKTLNDIQNKKRKYRYTRRSNSVLPFDGVIIPKLQETTHKILLRSGFQWCTYLQSPTMDDSFKEVSFHDDNTKSNYQKNLEVNLNCGDASSVGTFIENNQKNVDDSTCFTHHQVNNYQNNTGITEASDSSTTTQTSTQNKNNNNNNNNNNNITSTFCSPLKPPRNNKYKKTRHHSLNYHFPSNNLDNNFNYHNNSIEIIQKDVYLEPNNRHSFNDETTAARNYRNKYISIGVQVAPLPPYRLRVLPKCPQAPVAKQLDPNSTFHDNNIKKSSGCCFLGCAQCFGRVFMSQCGLGVALFAWALLGAAAFYYTEGPSELEQANSLKSLQSDLVIGLATDLRQIDHLQPVWLETIKKYYEKHEVLLLKAVSSGYGEGGGKGGQIWSYPGCILFAISMLTTLGFGAPVPRTTLGRTSAVIFSSIGIPLHFLLILNIGMVLARRLQCWSMNYPPLILNKSNEKGCHNFDLNAIALPKWINWFPVVAGVSYYIIGVLLFGVARQRAFESFLFPLDFTATGGVALTPGYIRIFYGLYLEGAVILAGIAVSLLQNSATNKLTDIGLKLGLLTNS